MLSVLLSTAIFKFTYVYSCDITHDEPLSLGLDGKLYCFNETFCYFYDHTKVKYYFPTKSGFVKKVMSRLYIWTVILGQNERDISCYQPEDDGYEIYSIYKSRLHLMLFKNVCT